MVEQGTQNRSFWKHPQQVWLRRAMFQIHLWVGLLLCVYCVLIGVSGSVLVFENELGRLSTPQLMGADRRDVRSQSPSIDSIADSARRAAPGWKLGSLYAPGVRGENYLAIVERNSRYESLFLSPRDGAVLGRQGTEEGWLNWVADLHFRLLGGPTGLIVNGIGAMCLVLLCVTGIVIWWPGVRTWKRALSVDFRKRWKRINFDLHSAIGFWTLALMMIWAVSGVYFVWPRQFVSAVSLISEAKNAAPPEFHLKPDTRAALPTADAVTMAQRLEPAGKLQGVIYASGDQPLTLMFAPGELNDFSHTTYLYLDPTNGKTIGSWRVDHNRTLGDWFIWLLEPLHFGIYWGLSVKIVWALLGLMLPLLAVTGTLMYWNRYLSKVWKRRRAGVHS